MKGGVLEPSGETKRSLASIENVKHGKAKIRQNNILIRGSTTLLPNDITIFIGMIIKELLQARHPILSITSARKDYNSQLR
jgi:hypothetical protein